MNWEIASTLPAWLGQLPPTGIHVNPIKVFVVIALMYGWAATLVWIDRDTNVVKTKREQWNSIVAFGSLVGFIVLLLVPWQGIALYFAGLAAWLVLVGAGVMAYVAHRNGRVPPQARVLTTEHFKRLMSGEGKKEKKKKDKGQRIRMANHEGKWVDPPDDDEGFADNDVTQDLLYDVLWRRATEVEAIAGREKYRVVYRIDGVAMEREALPVEDGERVFRYLKTVAGLNPQELRRPQTGTIQVAMLSNTGDLPETEVTTSGSTQGERLRLRVKSDAQLMRVNELGLAASRLETVKQMMGHNHGLTLISSPPKHGLTTTQYAVIKGHDAYIQNIHGLERARMLDLDNVTQHTYDGNNTDINYARQLQTVLRREPDIVLVSDCEDRETAQLATKAANNERKIYLGIHAIDCFDALGKYLALLEDPEAASRGLIGVTNQRLLRNLCTECREAFRPDPAMLKKLNLPADKIERFYRPPTQPLVDKKGNEVICPSCQGSGYVGRTGVFEVLNVDDEIRKLIASGASMDKIKTQCRKNRMYYLQEEAILKVIEGVTSMQEVLRAMKANGK